MGSGTEAFSIKRILIRMMVAVAALATGVLLLACDRTDRKPAGPPEKISVAYATLPETALAQVAQSRGYYRDEGLEVTARRHPYGKRALEDLLAGTADFATVAETPVMFAVMKGEQPAVIATIETSNLGHAILARKERGIHSLEDLRGKRIAATLGTTSDFFLDAITGVHGISRQDVEVVDLKAEDIPDALARGDIDAVSTFTPYVALTQKQLGDGVITFHDKEIYRYHFNVVTTRKFIRNHPETVKKMLRALLRSEEFVREHPEESQKIVADFSGIEISVVRDIWADARFKVTLDQSLILALEDESQWARKRGLTAKGEVPNFLDYIHLDSLKAVKPEAVRIL